MSVINFENNTEKETLRRAFDTDSLQLDTDKDTSNHVIVGRDSDRQEFSFFDKKKLANAFNNLGDGRTAVYVPKIALPLRLQK